MKINYYLKYILFKSKIKDIVEEVKENLKFTWPVE